jgi:hypothetical protein
LNQQHSREWNVDNDVKSAETASPAHKSGHSFTPGPWQVAGQFEDRTFVASRGKDPDCICKCDVGTTGLDHAANARLVASAPDLVEALAFFAAYPLEDFGQEKKKDAHPLFGANNWQLTVGHVRAARAALARARGDV